MAAQLRPLTDADPAALAALLDARHDRHRAAEPLLAPADAAAEIADLLGRERLTGAVAVDDGEVVGYLAGELRENRFWGIHAWVAHGAHAAADPELMRDLYAAAAPAWIEAGARLHLALVPAMGDRMDPWYRLGFGQMQVEGIRESGVASRPLPDGLTVRVAVRDDLPVVAGEHGMLVWEHQQNAATFTGLKPPDRKGGRSRLAGDVRRAGGDAVRGRARRGAAGKHAVRAPAPCDRRSGRRSAARVRGGAAAGTRSGRRPGARGRLVRVGA